MAKIVYEFDEDEERNDINLVVNRHKLISALYDFQNYRRALYKGYTNNATYVVDGKIIGKWQDIKDKGLEDAEITYYLSDEDVINEIDKILEKVSFLLD